MVLRKIFILSFALSMVLFCSFSSIAATINVDFEDLTPGTRYYVGDTISTSGITIKIGSFQWSGGTWTSDFYAMVDNDGDAGGTGYDLGSNNVNLLFDFGAPLSSLGLDFGEFGGNLNIEINGIFMNFVNLVDIDGLTFGSVSVSVTNGLGNDNGTLSLSGGTITSFFIGGQELWIDNVSAATVPIPGTGLLLGLGLLGVIGVARKQK